MPNHDASGADRSLLVIAFHYPPDNTSSGVMRTLKFTEYLLLHGWRSHVVSVPERLYASQNPAGAAAIPPAIEVKRVWACDVKSALAIRGRYPGWFGMPDRYWPWLFTGPRKGAQMIRSSNVDAIYSTSPVPTAHLIALRLKRRFGLPWIADFRDPWVEASMPRFRRWLEGRMELAVVCSADRVICNTPAMRRAFLHAYPGVSAEKFVTITNGYDEADLTRVVPVAAKCFHILYPGVIDAENRNPKALLRGVRKALDMGWLREDDLQITFLGAGPYGSTPQFTRDVSETRLERHVNVVVERIPYSDALSRMAGANVVVVLSEHLTKADGRSIQDWTAMQVPVKLYEYLRLGRPMLALVSEGAVKELLDETGAGVPIPPWDSERVAAALKRHYEERRPPPRHLPRASDAVEVYSRERLTSLLARELDAVAGARRIAHASSGTTMAR